MSRFVPTPADIIIARAILTHKLPIELVLQILDHAHYWFERFYETQVYTTVIDEEWTDDFSGVAACMFERAYPVDPPTRVKPEIREVEFTIVSRGAWKFCTCSFFYH